MKKRKGPSKPTPSPTKVGFPAVAGSLAEKLDPPACLECARTLTEGLGEEAPCELVGKTCERCREKHLACLPVS